MAKLSEQGLLVAENRYFHEGENWGSLALRVGEAIASVEQDKSYWTDQFAGVIDDMLFIPGGRTLRNAGRMKAGLLNCAALPIGDSIEEIGKAVQNAMILWSYGAGIGIDFSPLRHKGLPLRSKGGTASGMVSFLEVFDAIRIFDVIASKIETGGQRRSGCLAMCKVSHPEIKQFIRTKQDTSKFKSFNLSVAINDPFLQAVEDDDTWDLTSAGHKAETVKARELWAFILDNMISSAEPGLINHSKLVANNSYYFQHISCTNLCGEIPLPAYGMCCLGSLVLPAFLKGASTDWTEMGQTIEVAVRFLDNVLDVNNYPIHEMSVVTKQSRRLGLGVMGLADYLIAKKIRYGSEQALRETEKLFRFIRDRSYMASIGLAKEKGAFPAYLKRDYCNASFIRKLPPKLRSSLKECGIRNTCLLAAPPTGTTHLVAGCSSGIEPVFAMAYRRKDRISERVYIHSELQKILENGTETGMPFWLVDSGDLSPSDHLDMQVGVQKYLDNSVSKTINCPKGITVDDLSGLLLEYMRDLVGVTVYVDGSRGEQPLNRLTFKEAKKHLPKAVNDVAEEDGIGGCRSGACDL